MDELTGKIAVPSGECEIVILLPSESSAAGRARADWLLMAASSNTEVWYVSFIVTDFDEVRKE